MRGIYLRTLLVSGALLSAVAAEAQQPQVPSGLIPIEKQVDCDKNNGSINRTIDNLEPYKKYIIHVSGTCNEDVRVDQFEGQLLLIDGGGSENGAGGAVINNVGAGSTVFVSNSRNVNIRGFTINNTNSGRAAAAFNFCRGCSLFNSTIDGVTFGVSFTGSEGGVNNTTVLVNDATHGIVGINVQDLSDIGFGQIQVRDSALAVSALPSTGIQVGEGSIVQVNPGPSTGAGSLIEWFRNGVSVDSGATVTISGGAAGGPLTTIQKNKVGVSVNSGRVFVQTNSLITLNTENGLSASFNSDVGLRNGARIVANGQSGISLSYASTAQFGGTASNDIRGNNTSGGPFFDLFCGTHSFARSAGFLVEGFTNACGPDGANLNPDPLP